jgi:hypothetical protein
VEDYNHVPAVVWGKEDTMIPYDQIQGGDILIFKRKGFVSGVLGWLLKRFERNWVGWGWHMAIAWQEARLGYWILEAAGKGVRVNLIKEEVFKTEIRAYRWLGQPASGDDLEEFMVEELTKGYDAAVYIWTMLQYLILHFFNRSISRVLDNRFTCWELAFFFARKMGKPIQSIHKYPIITDFLKEVEKQAS